MLQQQSQVLSGRRGRAEPERAGSHFEAQLKSTTPSRSPPVPTPTPRSLRGLQVSHRPGVEDGPAARPAPLGAHPSGRRTPAGPGRAADRPTPRAAPPRPTQWGWAAWDRVVLTNLGFLPSAASSGPPALPAPGGPFRRSPLFSRPPRPGGEEGAQ